MPKRARISGITNSQQNRRSKTTAEAFTWAANFATTRSRQSTPTTLKARPACAITCTQALPQIASASQRLQPSRCSSHGLLAIDSTGDHSPEVDCTLKLNGFSWIHSIPIPSFQRHPSSAPIHSTSMASCRAFAARHDAALVTLAVLVAMALHVAGADADRWSYKHHHHHRGHDSPPAPPGFDQPTAAPSPPSVGDGPAASPFTHSWSYPGSDEPVADYAPSGAPADSPLPSDGSPKVAPLQESGLY